MARLLKTLLLHEQKQTKMQFLTWWDSMFYSGEVFRSIVIVSDMLTVWTKGMYVFSQSTGLWSD